MEGRMRRYGPAAGPDLAPEARAEPPQSKRQHRQQQQQPPPRRVPVVYYLCRNRHLEHPHFIEVPTSSSEGRLHLKDVINRLNVLRGKGMAAMYSWSCKRSYKNGFVWHDLCLDDIILPVNGNEYVLKGSELLDSSPSDRSHHAAQASKRAQEENPSPSSSRSEDASPSSSGVVIPEAKASPPSEMPQPPPPPAPAPETEASPDSISARTKLNLPSAGGGFFPSPADHRVLKAVGAADASTQTEEAEGAPRKSRRCRETRAMGVSSEEGPPGVDLEDRNKSRTPPRSTPSSEIKREEISPAVSSSSSGGKMETLESLIRAEAQKMNSFRILEEEELLAQSSPKLRATNMIMQLITCGSISVKGHQSFGLVPTYKPRFSHVNYNYASPVYSSSVVLGEMDGMTKSSRIMGLMVEGKECCSGNTMVEEKRQKDGGEEPQRTLQHSSSYKAEKGLESPDPAGERNSIPDSCRQKYLSKAVKGMGVKLPKGESEKPRSPLSDAPRCSLSARHHRHQTTAMESPKECRRAADASSLKGSSMRQESFQRDSKKVIKIEESSLQGLGS